MIRNLEQIRLALFKIFLAKNTSFMSMGAKRSLLPFPKARRAI